MATRHADGAARALRFCGLAAIAVAISLTPGAGAYAQDDSYGQIQFGPVGGGGVVSDLQQDRQFIRDWEGNPEPGFPTLAMANIEATKNAIKRYSDIVAAGGWKTVPDVTFKPGETHFAVVILRDRLLASGELTEDSGAGETYDTRDRRRREALSSHERPDADRQGRPGDRAGAQHSCRRAPKAAQDQFGAGSPRWPASSAITRNT